MPCHVCHVRVPSKRETFTRASFNSEQRQLVRETWARDSLLLSPQVFLIFLIGQSVNSSLHEPLAAGRFAEEGRLISTVMCKIRLKECTYVENKNNWNWENFFTCAYDCCQNVTMESILQIIPRSINKEKQKIVPPRSSFDSLSIGGSPVFHLYFVRAGAICHACSLSERAIAFSRLLRIAGLPCEQQHFRV